MSGCSVGSLVGYYRYYDHDQKLSGQKNNDKQVSDEKEEVVLSLLNDKHKLRCEEDILAICKRIRLLRGNPLHLMY